MFISRIVPEMTVSSIPELAISGRSALRTGARARRRGRPPLPGLCADYDPRCALERERAAAVGHHFPDYVPPARRDLKRLDLIVFQIVNCIKK